LYYIYIVYNQHSIWSSREKGPCN